MENSADKVVKGGKIGWRRDKPLEDPEKMKKWGLISAQPSEYLIHYRKGNLRAKSSGQGASCFKYPSDTVAIVPTSLKEVFFEANQITVENVEVRIRGMVLYHIVEPMKTYKLINFSFRERAEEKLATAIADMCRSSAKWLVANMTVEQCIRKRKEEIAIILKKDVDVIVSGGEGKEGWGVSIDNIDIQDVFIIDNEIFQHLQEDFKNQKRLEAENAKLAAEQEIAKNRLENQKKIKMLEIESKALTDIEAVKTQQRVSEAQKSQQLTNLQNDSEVKARAFEVQKAQQLTGLENEAEVKIRAVQIQKTQSLTELENQAALKHSEAQHQQAFHLSMIQADEEKAQREIARDQKITEIRKQLEELQFQLDKFRVEQNEQIALEKVKWACERLNHEAEQKFQARELHVKGTELVHHEIAAFKRTMREISNAVNTAQLKERFIAKALPEIAKAFGAQFSKINYTVMGGGDDKHGPLGVMAQTFNQVLAVCQLHGIDLKEMLSDQKPPEA